MIVENTFKIKPLTGSVVNILLILTLFLTILLGYIQNATDEFKLDETQDDFEDYEYSEEPPEEKSQGKYFFDVCLFDFDISKFQLNENFHTIGINRKIKRSDEIFGFDFDHWN